MYFNYLYFNYFTTLWNRNRYYYYYYYYEFELAEESNVNRQKL